LRLSRGLAVLRSIIEPLGDYRANQCNILNYAFKGLSVGLLEFTRC
jgi:hypothetical protein